MKFVVSEDDVYFRSRNTESHAMLVRLSNHTNKDQCRDTALPAVELGVGGLWVIQNKMDVTT